MSQELTYRSMYKPGFYVYRIINSMNGLQYIGSTAYTLRERWIAHISASHRKKHLQKPLYQDMQKYGANSFTIELIGEYASKFQMRRMEAQLILQHDTIWPNGYNLNRGRVPRDG